MPETVHLDRLLSIIMIRSYGAVTADDIRESFQSMQKIRRESGVDRVFVDMTQQESLPDQVEMLDIARELPLGFKAALLVSVKPCEMQQFTQRAAVNKGKNLWLFTEKESALEWLKSSREWPDDPTYNSGVPGRSIQ